MTTAAMKLRLEAQIRQSAAALTSSGFALNANILRNVKAVVGSDVLTVDADGTVVATTLVDTDDPVKAAVMHVLRDGDAVDDGQVVETDCGFPCMVTSQAVLGRPGMRVVLVTDTSALKSATDAAVRTMFVAAIISVSLLVLVSHVVVRRVTTPLQRLVVFVRGQNDSSGSTRAPVGDDEVGVLAEAFNGLLDRLDRSRAALVRSEKLGLAGLMAARVAHDIRNPLSSIRLQTQLLQASPDADEETSDTTAAILRDVDQVESVVRDLMELADPGELRLVPTSLNEVTRDALQQMAHQLAYRKIEVTLRVDENVPSVPLDRARLRQAILNVIANASEAMHTGGHLTVATGADDNTVFLRICDDGVGVDPAVMGRLFDPFVTTKPEGVGLGLVNVKSVVEGHGGHVRLEPHAPRGTCAILTLPGANRG